MAAIAVPLNTIFGVGCALALVRGKARGRKLVDALFDGVQAFRGDTPPNDDMTAVVIKISGN